VYNVTCQFGATVEIDARIVARDTMLALATIDVFEAMLEPQAHLSMRL